MLTNRIRVINSPLRLVTIALFLFLHSTLALSQTYPTQAIRLIVPYAAGGGADFVARVYAKWFTETLARAVVIDNRPGANGNIGADLVAKSAPDGYTLLLSSISTLSANVSLYPNLPFNVQTDFSPIGVLASQANVLVVHPSVQVKSVAELVALAKANPGKLTYGSAGTGSGPHLAGALFKMAADIDIVHVPYKGTAPATADLVGGHITFMFNNLPPSLPLVAEGKLKALAVTDSKRAAALSQISTMSEAGYPGIEMKIVNILLAPAGTPTAIIDKLNGEILRATQNTSVQEQLAAAGNEAVSSTPAQLSTMLRDDTALWAKVISQAKITLQ
ncbi:MAG: Bug family tripartite tricarboxylate transporter substrate binding protein [Zwartia sp.]